METKSLQPSEEKKCYQENARLKKLIRELRKEIEELKRFIGGM